MFSSIHFNNLLGIKIKRANVNREVRKLGNITWGNHLMCPSFGCITSRVSKNRVREKHLMDYNRRYSYLFVTIQRLFVTIRRYLLFAIRYSGFPDTHKTGSYL